MKNKPLVLAALVVTAVLVSAGSGLAIAAVTSRHTIGLERIVTLETVRAVTGGVAKAAVRVLVCRIQS